MRAINISDGELIPPPRSCRRRASQTVRSVTPQFEEHATLFAHVLTSDERSRVRDSIIQLITALLDRTMRAIPHPLDVDIPVAARFVASGFVGVIIDWFHDDRARDPDELAASLARLTPEWFRS